MLRSQAVVLAWISCFVPLAGMIGSCRMGYDVVATGGAPATNGLSTGGGGATSGLGLAGAQASGGQASGGGARQGTGGRPGTASSVGGAGTGGEGSTGVIGGVSGGGGGGGSGGQTSSEAVGGMAGAGSGGAGATCVDVTGCTCAEDGGVVYQFCQGPLNLLESGVACTLIGSTRGKVDDAAENEFIRQGLTDAGLLAPGADVYLGGTDVVTEGTWAWFDLSVYWDRGAATALYENWETPPASDALDCMVMTPSGLWREADCLVQRPFVCKR